MVAQKQTRYSTYGGLELSQNHESGLEAVHDHEAKAPEVVLGRSLSQQSPEPVWLDAPLNEKRYNQDQHDNRRVFSASIWSKQRTRKWTLAMSGIGAGDGGRGRWRGGGGSTSLRGGSLPTLHPRSFARNACGACYDVWDRSFLI